MIVNGMKMDWAEGIERGRQLEQQMLVAQAEAFFQAAVAEQPQDVHSHLLLANTLLKQGKLEAGFKEYEWRKYTSVENYAWFKKKPLWQGEVFSGKTLLVHSEQGLGDALQFVRYLPQVKARGGKVVLLTREPLASLLGGYLGIDEIRSEQVDLADFDISVAMMSLPAIFGTTLKTIPNRTPYLKPDAAKVAKWKSWLGISGKKKIGLVWSGNTYGGNLPNRSATLSAFAPLSSIEDVTLYSLQKGEAQKQLYSMPAGMTVVDLSPELKDFSETAAAIANLDLVISVDTSVPHLAGAMGKPVWVLVPFCSEWRWLMEREDSPWYPSMRLFRQKTAGDWQKPIGRIVKELKG